MSRNKHGLSSVYERTCRCGFVALATTVVACTEAMVEHIEYEILNEVMPRIQALVPPVPVERDAETPWGV